MKLDQSLLQRAVPPGSMRYYAWLYTPATQREVIAALFLLEAELHETARAAHEVAHLRLQWWREEVERLRTDSARHPATQVLQIEAGRCASSVTLPTAQAINFSPLHQVLLSTAQELANATYETDVELGQYLRGGLGGLLTVAAQFLIDAPTPALLEAATQLGAFIRQVEITRDLRSDFHHGRLYLPLVTLDELGIHDESLHGQDWPAGLVQLLQSRSQQQLAAYEALKQGLLITEKQALRPLLVLSEQHARLLKILAADPAQRTQQRVELSPMQKLWTAWRGARMAS